MQCMQKLRINGKLGDGRGGPSENACWRDGRSASMG
jgi:hypothetical protein